MLCFILCIILLLRLTTSLLEESCTSFCEISLNHIDLINELILFMFASDHDAAESTISGDNFGEESWGATFDTNDDDDSVWGFNTFSKVEDIMNMHVGYLRVIYIMI